MIHKLLVATWCICVLNMELIVAFGNAVQALLASDVDVYMSLVEPHF